jgi:hypothetical protein
MGDSPESVMMMMMTTMTPVLLEYSSAFFTQAAALELGSTELACNFQFTKKKFLTENLVRRLAPFPVHSART